MTMHGIPASLYGSYGQGWQTPSSTQGLQQAGQTQQSSSPMASILNQIQSSAQQLEAGGEDAQNAFTNAIQQMSQQLNPSLAAKGSGGLMHQTATITTTANGSSGTSTSSSSASNATAATSQTQTVHHRHHFGGGGDGDSNDTQQSQNNLLAGQTSASSSSNSSVLSPLETAISQLLQNQSSNPSLASFLNSQSASGTGSSAAGTSAATTSSKATPSLTQSAVIQSQPELVLTAIMNNGSSNAWPSTGGAGSASAQLQSLIQSFGSGSNASAGFGSWAQGVNSNLLGSMMSLSL